MPQPSTCEQSAAKPPELDPFVRETAKLDPSWLDPFEPEPLEPERYETGATEVELFELNISEPEPSKLEPADGSCGIEESQLALPLPVLRRKRKESPADVGAFVPDSEAAAERKKKKKRRLNSDVQFWLYCAGAVLFAVLGIFVWLVGFGRPLTMEDVAGTYVNEKDPGEKIELHADGTCSVSDEGHGGSVHIGGFVYSLKRRKITIELSEEMKPKPRKPGIFVDGPNRLNGLILAMTPTIFDAIVADFSDLTYSNGKLISPTKGRFIREPEPDELPESGGAAPARSGGGSGRH